MGRVRNTQQWKGHVPPEMIEDKGLPGKLYFPEPKVVNIIVKRSAGSPKVSILDANSKWSEVRLESTRALRDFNKSGELVEYQMGILPQMTEIREYVKACEIGGFGTGAVVARRWCADWRWETPQQWGVIVGVKVYTANTYNNETYSPFTVRWFDKSGTEDQCWAEDLYVIHSCLSKSLLGELIEAQND